MIRVCENCGQKNCLKESPNRGYCIKLHYKYWKPRAGQNPQNLKLCEACAELIRTAYGGNTGFNLDKRYHIGTPDKCENCDKRFRDLDMYDAKWSD